jgi:hypothetical protein
MVLLLLGGCSAALPALDAQPMPMPSGVAYHSMPQPEECVPYARRVSGLDLHGDAWTWWAGAGGRYERGLEPRQGAVLVLRRGQRLDYGHVAVVSEIVGRRQILVTHTNWGSDFRTRRRVYHNLPALDVSAGNNWSEIRFYNVDTGTYGAVYPAYGFIYRPGAAT